MARLTDAGLSGLLRSLSNKNKLIGWCLVDQWPKFWCDWDMGNPPPLLRPGTEALSAVKAFKIALRQTNEIGWPQPGLTCKPQIPLHPMRRGLL